MHLKKQKLFSVHFSENFADFLKFDFQKSIFQNLSELSDWLENYNIKQSAQVRGHTSHYKKSFEEKKVSEAMKFEFFYSAGPKKKIIFNCFYKFRFDVANGKII